MKYYYKLDENGKQLGKYARNQPNVPGLVLLDENPFDQAIWNGSEWVEDVDKYAQETIEKARQLLYSSWPDSSKTIAALKAQYDVLKSDSASWTSFTDADSAYEDFEVFMDLS